MAKTSHAQKLSDLDRTIIVPRESRDFEPEMVYFRSHGTDEGAVRFIRWEEVSSRLSMLRQLQPDIKWTYDLSSEADPLVLERLRELKVTFSASSATHLERLGVLKVPAASISLTSAAPLGDTVQTAQAIKPQVLSIGSLSALEELIAGGAVPRPDWNPTLHIVVRESTQQPLVNPEKLKPIVDLAKQAGFSSFGISVVVEGDLTTPQEHSRLIEAVRKASQSFAAEGVKVDAVQILGGLTDSHSLQQAKISLDAYLQEFSHTMSRLQAVVGEANPGSQSAMQVEAGQLLLGHFPTFAVVTNVKTQRTDGVREVFMVPGVYSDLAGHLYRKASVSIQVLPDPKEGGYLSSKLVEAVIHGGTCDSIDSLFDKTGTLLPFSVPENLKGGCLLVIYGKRLGDGATDFNKIPPAKLVIHDQYDDEASYKRSVLSDFQRPQFEAAERFWASERGQWLKGFFRETIDQIDRHQTVGTLCLGDLATNTEMRNERFQRVAQTFLKQDKDANGTVTFLDLQTYAATMRNVGRYLREMVALRPGETLQQARERMGTGSIPGVDKIFFPIKTFCDPIALMCQAATGFGHDAASAGEMWMSAGVGVSPTDVIVSHPHKTPKTLKMVCDPDYAPWAVTIDSQQELDRLVEAGLKKDTVIFIRFKATGASVVANLSAKFGHPVSSDVDKSKILELLKYARDKGFSDFGWAFHVGTQSSNKNDYYTALNTAFKLTKMARREEIVVRNFNIGGGICDERVAQRNSTTGKRVIAGVGAQVAEFRSAVELVIGERACIVAEPGRVTCAAAGFMMSQVVAGREADFTGGGRLRWAATRQGILSGNDHDEQYYELRAVNASAGARTMSYQVFGSSNRPNDSFPSIKDTQMHDLPVNLQRGDWLMTEGGIAYGWDASGPVDGIDPGRLIAFWTDENDKVHFFESPLSRREGLYNAFLEEHLRQHHTSEL